MAELFDVQLRDVDVRMTREELAAAMRDTDVLVPTVTDHIDANLLAGSGERLRLSATPLARVMAVLGERGSLDGDAVLAAVPRAEAPTLIRALVEAGVEIDEARWVGADLESVFMTETGWTGLKEPTHAG